MSRLTPARRIALFAVGSLINILMFCLAKYTAFPVYADYSGSFYITLLCGPVTGLLSACLHTALLIVFIDGLWALWLLLPVFAVCLLFFAFNRGRDAVGFSLGTQGFISLSTVFVCYYIIFLIARPAPFRYSQLVPAYNAVTESVGRWCASLYTAAGAALTEILLSFIVISLACLLTPKRKDTIKFK